MDGSVYAHNSHGQPFDNFGFGDSEAVEHTSSNNELTYSNEKEKSTAEMDPSDMLSQVIHSEEEAYKLYCDYAHRIGFSVRKNHNTYWPYSKKIKSKEYVCSKSGFKNNEPRPTVKPRFYRHGSRTGCPAMVRFKVDEQGHWTVSKFIQQHNHELARPQDRHLLRSHRLFFRSPDGVSKMVGQSGVRLVDGNSYLMDGVENVQNFSLIERDLCNFLYREHAIRMEPGDSLSLLNLFKERHALDSMFAWDVQIDQEQRVTNFFWADGRGRIDYDCFGDVVVLDSSCRLNKYNCLCALFIGVNHHWQNVFFGAAFLLDESVASYKWLLETFLTLMGSKSPVTILTDLDEAITKAVEDLLPSTQHRFCPWNVSNKASSKVHCLNDNKAVEVMFKNCLSNCESEEELEKNWAEMLNIGDLHQNLWLQDLYKLKDKWSMTIKKSTFDMGVFSAQRNDKIDNVFHEIFKPTSSLTSFFLRIEKMAKSWRWNESEEDFRCSHCSPTPMIPTSPLLNHACKLYTRKFYKLLEDEYLHGLGGLSCEEVACDNNISKFHIKHLDSSGSSRVWTVMLNPLNMDVSCSCKKFETMGLLCSHALKALNMKNICQIPDKYILKRLTTGARKDIYACEGSRKTTQSMTDSNFDFCNCVSRWTYYLCLKAGGNEKAQAALLNALKKALVDVEIILEKGSSSDAGSTDMANGNRVHAIEDGNTIPSPMEDSSKMSPKVLCSARPKEKLERKSQRTRKKVKLDAGKANYHIDDCITTTSSSESYKEEILQHVPEPAWNGHLMPYSSRPTIFRSIPLGFTKDDNGYLLHSRLPNVDLQMKGNIIVESQPQHSDAPSPTKTS